MEMATWSFHPHQHTRCCFIAMASSLGWLLLIISYLSQINRGQSPSLLLFSEQISVFVKNQPPHSSPISAMDQSPPPHDHEEASEIAMESPLPDHEQASAVDQKLQDSCSGRYIFMHNLPRRFNQDLISNCSSLSPWTNMCKYLLNGGFGQKLHDPEAQFPQKGWFATDQFSLEVIFHERMKHYKCLTPDYAIASAFFIPFYAGLDFSRYIYGFNTTVRDADAIAMAEWIRDQRAWKAVGGRDHFMVGGRITWDFRRAGDGDRDRDHWGNKLLFLPEFEDLTMLVLEASGWFPNDVGIPYPTYFHPKYDSEIIFWQKRVRNAQRSSLFSFAGAPRPQMEDSIREIIIHQCERSDHCRLLEQCDHGLFNCRNPAAVMKFFEESVFCLQPPGDSLTRRSIFDSMLAGCIPVFFHEESAYSQYVWHLPHNHTKYSVFISIDEVRRENVSIEKVLNQIAPEQIRSMREEVINLIPGFIYAHPQHQLQTMRDAFDISVQAVLDKAKAKKQSYHKEIKF